MSQGCLGDYDRRAEDFNRVRALIMKVVAAEPGLTVEEISKAFLLRFGFLPRIDNRLREARVLGWVESRAGEDEKLHWFLKAVEADAK
jgi:hypothetical protein